MIVGFVDISGIDYHHCLNFLFISILNSCVLKHIVATLIGLDLEGLLTSYLQSINSDESTCGSLSSSNVDIPVALRQSFLSQILG